MHQANEAFFMSSCFKFLCIFFCLNSSLAAQVPDYVGVSGQTSVESATEWRRDFAHEVTYSHHNIGQQLGTSGTMNIRYELVPDAGGFPIRLKWRLFRDTALQTQDRQVGAPGGVNFAEEVTSYLVVPDTVPFGNYDLRVIIDSGDRWDESNENNNAFTLSTNIIVIRTPDLVFTSANSLTISGTDYVRAAGESFTLNYTFTNEGDLVTIPAFLVQYHLESYDTAGRIQDTVFLGTRAAPSLSAAQQATLGFGGRIVSEDFDLPAGLEFLTYRFRIHLDAFETVTEYSDRNNREVSNPGRELTVQDVLDRPDYQADGSSENTFSPASAPAGNFVTFSGNVLNTTGFPSGNATTIRVVLTPLNNQSIEYDVGITGIPPIPANSSRTFSADLRVPSFLPPGDYRYAYHIDDAGVVAERSEINNKGFNFAENLEVTAPVLADLAVTSSGQVTPTLAEIGEDIVVQAPFENDGASGAANFQVDFYLSENSSMIGDASDILLGSRSVISLAAGGSADLQPTLTLPASVPPGLYYVGWKVDGTGVIDEFDEGNNSGVAADRISIIPAGPTKFADLVPANPVVPGGINFAGDKITLSLDIENRGDDDSQGTQCRFYLALSDDVSAETTIDLGLVSVPAISAGGSLGVDDSFIIPTLDPLVFGDYRFLAVVDPGAVVLESDELNNSRFFDDARVTIGSKDPDDYAKWKLQSPSLSPASVLTGSSVDLFAKVVSESDGAIGGLRLKVYLSADEAVSPGSDTLLFTSSPLDFLAAESFVFSEPVSLPESVLPGGYHILWQLDGLQTLLGLDSEEPQASTSLFVREPRLSVEILSVDKDGSFVEVRESSEKVEFQLESSISLEKWDPVGDRFMGNSTEPIILKVPHSEDEHVFFRYYRLRETK